eukprot:CAMPEP_0175608314 /NCGR_PEP_ID=MMETSP0096-20121207/61679_1 /TAXON_ID=311494 /ORGANISM="Alexandrium monilatum, Strain CCMP3105" /LENGTH=76 /DNA_ID=CAMNT_0016913195 /DNA_START=263 /DNA_END=490 /DNA_ORIENTATION=-
MAIPEQAGEPPPCRAQAFCFECLRCPDDLGLKSFGAWDASTCCCKDVVSAGPPDTNSSCGRARFDNLGTVQVTGST